MGCPNTGDMDECKKKPRCAWGNCDGQSLPSNPDDYCNPGSIFDEDYCECFSTAGTYRSGTTSGSIGGATPDSYYYFTLDAPYFNTQGETVIQAIVGQDGPLYDNVTTSPPYPSGGGPSVEGVPYFEGNKYPFLTALPIPRCDNVDLEEYPDIFGFFLPPQLIKGAFVGGELRNLGYYPLTSPKQAYMYCQDTTGNRPLDYSITTELDYIGPGHWSDWFDYNAADGFSFPFFRDVMIGPKVEPNLPGPNP